MSFSFRNIFSPDESGADPGADSGLPGGFTAPPGSPHEERGNLTGASEKEKKGNRQVLIASELLPLIPPAIVAQSGIPMEKEIEIPLPEDGSLDVKLSTLYRLCPELFAAEITPLNDSTITLPLRIGAPVEVPLKSGLLGSGMKGEEKPGSAFWSPLGAGAQGSPAFGGVKEKPSTAPPAENAFSAGPPPMAESVFGESRSADQATAEGGFKMPGGFEAGTGFATPAKTGNAFGPGPVASSSTPPAIPEMAPGFSGFQAAPSAKDEGADREFQAPSNPFESDQGFASLFSKQAEKDASIPHPGAGAGSGGGSAKVETEGVWGAMFRGEIESEESDEPVPFASIGKLLKEGVAQEQADSDKVREPETGEGHSPFGFATPAPGPEAGGTPAGFAAPSAPALPVEFGKPAETAGAFASGFESFQASPAADPKEEASRPGEKAGEISWSFNLPAATGIVAGEPEVPPVSSMPESPAASEPAPALPAPEGNDPFAGFASAGFEAPVPPLEKKADEASAAQTFKVEMHPATELKTEVPAPSPVVATEPVPAPSPVVAAEPVPAPSVPHAKEPETVVPLPAPPAAVAKSEPVPEPAPAIQTPAQAATKPEAAPASGEGDDLRDLEFRAIFSTSETFTLSMLARKMVALPGIASCSLSTPGKLVQASRREENRLGNQAREMIETLRSLAKLTGLPEAKTFTLQTDRGIVSLFLEGDHCVCVNQEGAAFEPGVREKLILIARCLHRLRD